VIRIEFTAEDIARNRMLHTVTRLGAELLAQD